MNQNTPVPWVEVDADDGTFSLYGNTEGFRALRKAIDDLLAGGVEDVTLDIRPGGVESISLANDHPDDLRGDLSPRHKMLSTLGIFVVLSIPASILLLAAFGLIQLIDFFSKF